MERGGEGRGLIFIFLFIVAYAALYLYYIAPSLNSPEPSLFGASRALVYALVIWILMMASVIGMYLYLWR